MKYLIKKILVYILIIALAFSTVINFWVFPKGVAAEKIKDTKKVNTKYKNEAVTDLTNYLINTDFKFKDNNLLNWRTVSGMIGTQRYYSNAPIKGDKTIGGYYQEEASGKYRSYRGLYGNLNEVSSPLGKTNLNGISMIGACCLEQFVYGLTDKKYYRLKFKYRTSIGASLRLESSASDTLLLGGYNDTNWHTADLVFKSNIGELGFCYIRLMAYNSSSNTVDISFDVDDTKPTIEATNLTIKTGDSFHPLQGVTANDAEDGDLTNKIQVIKNTVDTTKAGSYEVVYQVADSAGNVTEKTIIITVKSDSKPVIHALDQVIQEGDNFDPHANVSAMDSEDGDLTSKIQIVKNTVDTTKAGSYEVVYRVTDSDGNVAEKAVTITVKSNDKPAIDTSDRTLKVGETFDPQQGVTAKDTEDGDLTSKIQIVKNTVDTTKAGSYEVVYRVTDSDGNVAEKAVTIIVTKDTAEPTIDRVTNDSQMITGTGESGNDVTIATSQMDLAMMETNPLIIHGQVDSSGHYQIKTPILPAGALITVTTIDPSTQSHKQITSQIVDTHHAQAITVEPVYTTSTFVAGTGEPGGIAYVKVDGKWLMGSKVDVTGHYQVAIPNQPTGKKITVSVVTPYYASEAKWGQATTIVKSLMAVTTIDPLTDESRIVTGSAEPGAQVEIKAGNTVIGLGTADVTGHYSISIPAQQGGVEITAQALRGNETSNLATTIVETVSKGTINPHDYIVGQPNITGTYTGTVVQAQLYVNGKYVSTGGTFKDGKFTYYVKKGTIKNGDHAEIIALNKNKKHLDQQVISVINVTEGTITPHDYTVGQMNITGTYTGDIVQAQLYVNGKYISTGGTFTGGTFTNGTFQYHVNANFIKKGQEVKLVALDSRDQVLDTKLVEVKDVPLTGKFTSATYQLGDVTIKGSYTGDIAKAKVYINGVQQAWGGIFNVGAFSYYIGKGKITKGDKVTIEGLSQDNQQLDTIDVEIIE